VEYKLSYCLRSDKHPDQNMIVNNRTWYQLLELAEAYGWNPMGTMLPEWLAGLMEWMSRGEAYPEGLGGGSYTPISSRLVVLEDTPVSTAPSGTISLATIAKQLALCLSRTGPPWVWC
jgi:hypothetical protein